jgi:predicted PurR-regulated permease PerM
MPASKQNNTPWKFYRKFAFPILWILVIGFFMMFSEVLAPFIGAILIAYLLTPLVRRIHATKIGAKNIPRWVAVLGIYLVVSGLVSLYFWLAVPSVSAEVGKLVQEGEKFVQSLTPEKLESYTTKVKTWIEESGLPIRIVSSSQPDVPAEAPPGFVLNIEEVVRKSVADISESFRANFFSFLKLGPQFMANFIRNILMTFLIFMVAAFLLSDPQRILKFVQTLFPHRLHHGYGEVIEEIDTGLAGVVRGQVLIGLLNGVLTFIGMLILGVKFPFLLSTLTAVLSLIPIFGSFISGIPIFIVGITASWATGFGILLWLIGINILEANFFNPKIIGASAKIHPALVVFALLAGEHIYGVVGALFAVPVLSVALAFFKVLHRRAMLWSQDDKKKDTPDDLPEPETEPST